MAADQYRAYFYDPDVPRPERPEQIFGCHKPTMEDWARKKLEKGGPRSEVWLYTIKETLEGSYKKKT